ncbi:MAG: AMP-binding protein [Alphaproteobacteria bacterium]|nr:AMP-binding protein [Alphaproteobacteria bacterium]
MSINQQDDHDAGKAVTRRLDPQPTAVPVFQRPKDGTVSAEHIEARETIADVIRGHARRAPEAPAFVAEGLQPLTYAALVWQMDNVQQKLNAMGFGRGDRIAIVAPNGPPLGTLVAGIWGCAAAVPMNPTLSVGEFAIYLRDLKVQAVAVRSGWKTPAREAARQVGLSLIEVEYLDSDVAGLIDILPASGTRTAARPGPTQLDDVAMVLLTSGTTSHSKTVPATQRQLSIKFRRNAGTFDLTTTDRCLNLMPLFHGHGLHTALGATLYSGGSMVTLAEFSAEAFFRLLATMEPTWYTGSYTFHHTICAVARDHLPEIGKSNLRFIRTGSGHLESKIADQLESIFKKPVIEGYSCTEVGRICTNPMPPRKRKRGTVGLPVAAKVAIVGPDWQFLPTGKRGEVVVDTSDNFTGYENDPVANSLAFHDGWFRTGDEGFFDDEGYLTLSGRIKDIINRGGEKITPSEVDAALMAHPDVATAVTFPVPHLTLGQEVAAAVVPEKGAEMTDETLTRFLRGRLAPFKVPRRFVIVDEIPRGPTGKVSRQGLAEQFGLVTDSAAARPEPTEDDRPATALEAKLQRLWQETLRLDRVGLHEDFFTLGGDSLQAVELFLRVEKEFGRRLPRSVLFEAGTVAKMAERIEAAVPSSCIVPIQTTGDLPPFFCVHDGFGQVLNYRDLSLLLGENQPFYGIQARGIDGEEEPFVRIEDMAAHYVHEVRKVQPEGPYYIGGHSFGGRVAYVMAQQLVTAGEEIAFLALFDTYSRAGQQKVSFRDWLRHHSERLKALPASRVPGYLWLRVQNIAGAIYLRLRLECYSAAWKFCKSRGKPLPRLLRRVEPANDMIRRAYRVQPYDGDATLFKAELSARTHSDAHDGWYKLVRGRLEIRPIPGTHHEIMNQPHVRTVAVELADEIDKARAAYAMRINAGRYAS